MMSNDTIDPFFWPYHLLTVFDNVTSIFLFLIISLCKQFLFLIYFLSIDKSLHSKLVSYQFRYSVQMKRVVISLIRKKWLICTKFVQIYFWRDSTVTYLYKICTDICSGVKSPHNWIICPLGVYRTYNKSANSLVTLKFVICFMHPGSLD